MVSDQELGLWKPVRPLRVAAAGLTLTLFAGCSMFGGRPAAAPPPPPAAAAAPVVESGPQTAVDAAILRGETAAERPAPAMDAPPAASGPVLNPNAPKSYTVKRGDTLWGISAMFLRDPWLWPEIWHVNPTVRNPHLIYPGDVLALAYGADGRPQIDLIRGPGNATRVEPMVRSTSLDGPIATIPYEAIAAFLGRPGVVSNEELRTAPQVAALRNRHLVAGAGHEVYIRGLQDKAGGRYNVIQLGEPLEDPETGKVLGYLGNYAGAARVDATEKLSKGVLTESARETKAGDLLFADDLNAVNLDLTPHAGPADLDGQIMAVVDGVMLIGQYQVVAINRGTRHGVEPGHVLAIDERGEVVRDRTCRRGWTKPCINPTLRLPDERTGTLLVFKTFDRLSYGLIVSVTTPVRVADHVRAP
jgi:hypothetical protein